jgi:hypothetical protein
MSVRNWIVTELGIPYRLSIRLGVQVQADQASPYPHLDRPTRLG